MDKMLLKKAAMQSVALMIGIITLSYAIHHYHSITIEASNQKDVDQSTNDHSEDNEQSEEIYTETEDSLSQNHLELPISTVADLKNRLEDNILKQLSDHFLVIKKPEGDSLTITLTDLYVKHAIELNINGMVKEDLTSNHILRVRGNDLFIGDPLYTEIKSIEVDKESGEAKEVISKDFGDDISQGIEITTTENKVINKYSAKVLIELDKVYAYNIYQDPDYYYIDLKSPSEVYDRIIVIDPGHGGKDVGAISRDEQYYEKDINLDIVHQLQKLLEKDNIKVYYTRTEDETVFLRPRVTLANEVDSDYFISIHCNSNTLSSPHGSEVLYYNTEAKGIKAAELAAVFADELGNVIPLRQRGTVKKNPEDLFIMDHAVVPTILIEVGYMSNSNDMFYLSNPENRKTIAQGIYNGIIRAYEELPVTE